ncbi:Protein of unknown function [Kytococcus aerolatus]|uniref:DUF2505 domain-containing protein n=1 Tax=Kytococcus aerolatus TaxID=592308 RepID=A0A212TZU5_9MICO|nr:DUF2505 domain-containing protein [Kytococcus aerolatus]SNC71522.1 Protein of unknown function [Kytococcus aerolatus]
MRIDHEFTLPAPLDEVVTMLGDPAYVEDKIRRTGATEHTLEVTTDGPGPVVRSTRKMPTGRLPDMARKVVGDTVTLQEHQEWGAPEADGSRSGKLTVTAGNAPARLEADLRIEPRGEETVFRTTGDFTVKVPFLGKQLEKQAEPYVGKVLGVEEKASREWLATH